MNVGRRIKVGNMGEVRKKYVRGEMRICRGEGEGEYGEENVSGGEDVCGKRGEVKYVEKKVDGMGSAEMIVAHASGQEDAPKTMSGFEIGVGLNTRGGR